MNEELRDKNKAILSNRLQFTFPSLWRLEYLREGERKYVEGRKCENLFVREDLPKGISLVEFSDSGAIP